MVEEINASVQSLSAEAQRLAERVSAFRTSADQPAHAAGPVDAPAPRARHAAAPAVHGALALKADEDDWAEF